MTQKKDIRRDTDKVFSYITAEAFFKDMPKLWRCNVYPAMLRRVLDMRRYVYDAYADEDNRVALINKFIVALDDTKALMRIAHENYMITHRQADYLDSVFVSIREQAVRWKSYSQK